MFALHRNAILLERLHSSDFELAAKMPSPHLEYTKEFE